MQVDDSALMSRKRSAAANDEEKNRPPEKIHKLPDNNHGNRFQSKLLLLFYIRSINKKYGQFCVGTELDEFGGKFDDLIFIRNDDNAKSFLYLQAKHRLHEEPHLADSITTADLLNDSKSNDDFSILKYLDSYVNNIMSRASPGGPATVGGVVDCVICTNIRFNDENLKKNGIELVEIGRHQLNPLPRDLLTFDTDVKWWKFLANVLYHCACAAKENKPISNRLDKAFKSCLHILLKENVIILSTPIKGQEQTTNTNYVFHVDFLDSSQRSNRSVTAKEVRKTLIALKLGNEDEWKTWKFITIGSSTKNKEEIKTIKEFLPTFYRFESIPWLSLVANELRDCATINTGNKIKALDRDRRAGNPFNKYLSALLKENVICTMKIPDSEFKRHSSKQQPTEYFIFHTNFIGDNNDDLLSEGAAELRRILVKLVGDDSWKTWKFIKEIESLKKTRVGEIENRELIETGKKKDMDAFFQRFVFAINTPNEDELDDILKSELGTRLNLKDTDLQSDYILNQIVNWFKMNANKWLSAEEGEKIFEKTKEKMGSIRAVGLSRNNQTRLNPIRRPIFNEKHSGQMAEKLNSFFQLGNIYQVLFVTTPAPELTAIKLIAALQHDQFMKKDQFKREDGFLLTLLSGWRLGFEKELMMVSLNDKNSLVQLLIVVCDDDATLQIVDDDASTDKNFCLFKLNEWHSIKETTKVIVISTSKTQTSKVNLYFSMSSIQDTINYDQLSKDFEGDPALDEDAKPTLMDSKFFFQGKEMSVRDLIPSDGLKDVFDPSSLIEFLSIMLGRKKTIAVPSFDTSSQIEKFLQSFYIDRRIKVPFDQQFRDELTKELGRELSVDASGKIHWSLGDQDNENKRKEIWKSVKLILEKRNSVESSSSQIFDVDELTSHDRMCWGKGGAAVIISSVAGTGKSSALSRLYQLIKENNHDWWVIKIYLVDHLEALRTAGPFDQSTVVDFLADIPEIIGDGNQSPFVRSLLKHRLKTGDRIVFMLDGFDEIDGLCRTKSIELMEAVTETNSVGLYVTTRPHTADELQLRWSQLAYTLDNFDEEDQTEFLTKFWGEELEEKGVTMADKMAQLKKYAKTLVERVKKSLKDEDRAFIGIPLQCRIVGECFLEEIRIQMSRNEGDGLVEREHQEDEQQIADLDLTNLYGRLMNTKRNVFLREKLKISPTNNISNVGEANNIKEDGAGQLYLKKTMKSIENHLVKLAVETIFSKREHVDMLLSPRSFVYQSDENHQEEQEWLDQLSVSYGLTTRNGKGKIEFLHRTFAEYLVADYLYQGFVLDEKRHNKLLEVESTRDFITTDLLKERKYDGVFTFLDFMLERLVESQEWRSMICRCAADEQNVSLPNRHQQIATIIKRNSEERGHAEILKYVVELGKVNVLKLFLDCLEESFHRTTVRELVQGMFEKKTFNIFSVNANILKQLFRYYDDADNYCEIEQILTSIFQDLQDRLVDKIKGAKETIRPVIGFMKKHGESFERYLTDPVIGRSHNEPQHVRLWNMVMFLLANVSSSSVRVEEEEACFDLLSIYEKYDVVLQRLLEEFSCYFNDVTDWIRSRRMEKLLIGLRDRQRTNTLNKVLSQFVLLGDSELFEEIYQPKLPAPINQLRPQPLKVAQSLLMSRDSCGWTLLHRAAFYGDKEVVKWILETLQCGDDNTDMTKFNVESVERLNEGMNFNLTPSFFIAALRGHEDVCRILLVDYRKRRNGDKLVRSLLEDAFQSAYSRVFKFIAKVVKETLGLTQFLDYCRSIFSSAAFSGICQSSVDVVFQDEDEASAAERYAFLGELLLNSERFRQNYKKQMKADVLRGMLQTVGVDWILRFLHKEAKNRFDMLERHFRRDVLDEVQRQQFATAITSPTIDDKGVTNFWADSFISSYDFAFGCTRKRILNWIADVLGETELKNFLLNDYDGSGVFVARVLLRPFGVKFAEKAIARLTDVEMKQQVRGCLAEKGPQLIKERLFSRISPPSLGSESSTVLDKLFSRLGLLVQVLVFYLEHASCDQLSTFVEDVTAIREIDGRKISLWCQAIQKAFEETKDMEKFTKILPEKLGNEAVEKLVLHQDDKGNLVFASDYFENEKKVKSMYGHFPKKKRNEIRYKLLDAVSHQSDDQIGKLIADETRRDPSMGWTKRFLGINEQGMAMDLPNGFNDICLYFLDKFDASQLRRFVELTTTKTSVSPVDDEDKMSLKEGCCRSYSIWSDYVGKACTNDDRDVDVGDERPSTSCRAMEKFLDCVQEKLTDEKDTRVRDLLFHDDGGGRVIHRAGQSGNLPIIQVMLNLLDKEQRSDILHDTFSQLDVIQGVRKAYGSSRFSLMTRHLLAVDGSGVVHNLVDGLDLLSLYFLHQLEDDDLKEFLHFVLQDKGSDCNNIWTDYIEEVCTRPSTYKDESINKPAGSSTTERPQYQHHRNAITNIFNRVSKLMSGEDNVNNETVGGDNAKEQITSSLVNHTIKGLANIFNRGAETPDAAEAVTVSAMLVQHLTDKKSEPDRQARRDTLRKLNQLYFAGLEEFHLLFQFAKRLERVELTEFVDLILSIDQEEWNNCMSGPTVEKVDLYYKMILDLLDVAKRKFQVDEMKRLMNHDATGINGPTILRHLRKISPLQNVSENRRQRYRKLSQYLTKDAHRDEFLKLLSSPTTQSPSPRFN